MPKVDDVSSASQSDPGQKEERREEKVEREEKSVAPREKGGDLPARKKVQFDYDDFDDDDDNYWVEEEEEDYRPKKSKSKPKKSSKKKYSKGKRADNNYTSMIMLGALVAGTLYLFRNSVRPIAGA